MIYHTGRPPYVLFRLLLLSLFLFAVHCADEDGNEINPDDLLGTWRASVTGVTLTFASGTGGHTYVMRDPLGYFISGGDDLLVQGYWYVSGSSLYLEDEAGPLACPPNDHRFVVLLDDEKANMWLTQLGSDECADRTRALEDYAWQRVNEG
jgi:hypothetical protein